MNDEDIINLYFSRNQNAILETDAKYGNYCRQIAGRILGDPRDTEETVNDAWMKVWASIPPNRPAVLKLYLAKITRNLAFTRYRHETAQKRGKGEIECTLDELDDCISSTQSIDDELDKAELTASIQRLLQTLPEQHRYIFIRRYFFVETTGQIAERYGMKESNVLMILARVRKKLKTHLIKEGYFL